MSSSKQNDSNKYPVALILGTGQCALGTIRSLKDNSEITIVVTGNKARGLAQYSKYVHEFIPCDQSNSESIYKALKQIDDKYDAVIPIPTGADFWVDVIINSPFELKHFITDLKAEYTELMKKSVQQQLAFQCEVPYPQSIKIINAEDLDRACDILVFPCVVKPVSRANGEVPFRIRYYKSSVQLGKDIEPLLGSCNFLASTHIPGPDKNIYTYGSFATEGVVKAEYFGRKLTQRPTRFGVAGLAESVGEIDELRQFSQALIKESNFSGISQIEFKKHSVNGKYYLMEMNPRIWLWMQTAKESGVNLAMAYYCHLAGLPETEYQQSKKCMFINGLSMFDNTFREKKLTWLSPYLKSRFIRHIYSIKDKNDPNPYRIERRRFLKKLIH